MAPLAESRMFGLEEPSYSPRSVWDQDPDCTAGFLEVKNSGSQSPYARPSIWWINEFASAPVVIDFGVDDKETPESEVISGDADLGDRLVLLVKKYAMESVALPKEDSARLGILNRRVDLKYSRYSDSDFAVLSEADDILEKFKKLEAKK